MPIYRIDDATSSADIVDCIGCDWIFSRGEVHRLVFQAVLKKAMVTVQAKLREFETIADTYTENGTPDELQAMIEGLEEMMDELQMLEDNNPPDDAKSE